MDLLYVHQTQHSLCLMNTLLKIEVIIKKKIRKRMGMAAVTKF